MLGNDKVIKRMLDEIEKQISMYEVSIQAIEQSENKEKFLKDIHSVVAMDVLLFVDKFMEFSEEEARSFDEQMADIYSNYEELEILKEQIRNLYYLKEDKLLEYPHVRVQYEEAVNCINNFRRSIEEQLNRFKEEDFIQQKSEFELEIVKLYELVDCFGDEGLSKAISDISVFTREIEKLNLSEEEKTQLMFILLSDNVKFYEEMLTDKKQTTAEMLEIARLETEEELEDVSTVSDDKVLKISEELRNGIDVLLNDPSVINKVLSAIDGIDYEDDFVFDDEEVAVAKELAEDYMLDRLIEDDTQELDALLEDFYKDATKDDSLDKLRERLFGSSKLNISKLEENEKLSLVDRARSFVDEHKKLIYGLDSANRDMLEYYIDYFSEDSDNREIVYSGRLMSSYNSLNTLIVYELEKIFTAINSLVIDEAGAQLIFERAVARIEEIFTTYDKLMTKENEKENDDAYEEKDGHLFFVDHNGDVTDGNFFMSDIDSIKSDKESIKQYRKSLSAIKARGYKRDNKTGKVTIDKLLKSEGVNFRGAYKTRVIYIPVGEKDSIILGATMEGAKYSNEMAARLRGALTAIHKLKDIIRENGEEYKALVERTKEIETKVLDGLDVSKPVITEIDELTTEEKEELIEEMLSDDSQILDDDSQKII